MELAYPIQKFQDWFTQQWVILWGIKIDPKYVPWLMGPFGNLNGIGDDFIGQLAEKENLVIERNVKSRGLISSITSLNLPDAELLKLSNKVIDFYENTSNYKLEFAVKWNPFFKIFGVLVNKLFSNRINQLNIPTKNVKNSEAITSELITLSDPKTNQVKYTVWFRSFKSSGQVIYSGVYGTCILPSEEACIKAVFPLPKGNATVIMTPSVGENGELILNSSGKEFGDAGFYFTLIDSKGNYWSQYISSFRDKLIVNSNKDVISAEQTLSLWHQKVLRFNYKINTK
mgnify:CR=1 FL=1|tara:strand:+ start:27976 stop:28833 length:858 start_codon:yes stop_codon:yes gene_type:complete